MSLLAVKDVKSFPKQTQNAGTVIRQVVPYVKKCKTAISYIQYLAGSTAHTITVMKPYGKTTLSAAAAAGQAVVNLTADPGTGTTPGAIAANDVCVIEAADGTLTRMVVSSVSTLAVTMTANVPTGGFPSGANVWFYGVVADGHPSFITTASATNELKNGDVLVAADKREEPLIIESDNATNAGTLQALTAVYIDTGK